MNTSILILGLLALVAVAYAVESSVGLEESHARPKRGLKRFLLVKKGLLLGALLAKKSLLVGAGAGLIGGGLSAALYNKKLGNGGKYSREYQNDYPSNEANLYSSNSNSYEHGGHRCSEHASSNGYYYGGHGNSNGSDNGGYVYNNGYDNGGHGYNNGYGNSNSNGYGLFGSESTTSGFTKYGPPNYPSSWFNKG